MKLIVLIAIGSLLIFSAIGYFLYSSFSHKSFRSAYWQNRHLRKKNSEQFEKEIYRREKELSAYKKLITLTVQCRNLTQKISQEINSLINRMAEKDSIQTIELHYLQVFQTENQVLVNKLEELENDREIILSNESSAFKGRLMGCMNTNQEIIRGLLISLAGKDQTFTEYTLISEEIAKNCNSIVAHHNWIVAQFKAVFESMQS